MLKPNTSLRIVTVGWGRVRGKARNYKYFEPCIYSVYKTKDNRILYKFEETAGFKTRRSYSLAERDAQQYAKDNLIGYIKNVRHWETVI